MVKIIWQERIWYPQPEVCAVMRWFLILALLSGMGALQSCGPSKLAEQKPYKPSLAFGREAGFQLGVQARAGLPVSYQPKLDWLAQTLKNRQIQPKPIGLFASQREYAFRHRGAAGCPHCPVQAGLMFSSAKPFQHRFRILMWL